MRKTLLFALISLHFISFRPFWGFFGHREINGLAVFTLPPEMIGFYKENVTYIKEASVNPDKRRYAVAGEAARHYLDFDHYPDSVRSILPKYWNEAVKMYHPDTLNAYGVLPWHIRKVYDQLQDAFIVKDPSNILRLSAELGHYIADAHVPLHTTENYNGQLTGQEGIHSLWESRLPELFSVDYNFFVGRSEYISDPQAAAWTIVKTSHQLVDSVLRLEQKLGATFQEKRYAFETKGKQTMKVYSTEYANAYHKALSGMVERRMRSSITAIGSFWYSAWVDAGQPDLKQLISYRPTEKEIEKRRQEMAKWREGRYLSRQHED